jgi:hypothetical protein
MRLFSLNRICALFLIVTILATTVFAIPQKSYAQLVVTDPGNTGGTFLNLVENAITSGSSVISSEHDIQDQLLQFVLKPLAWAAARAAIAAMTQSLVTWINSGFEGSPAFATNLKNNMRQLGDAVAAGFINELIDQVQINSPYLDGVVGTIARGYLLYTSREAIGEQLRYTLGNYAQNEEAFRQGQFNQGGFNAWFAVTTRCGNDPFCVEQTAREELVRRVDTQLQQRLTELGWGRGFLSWRNCPDAPQADSQDAAAGATELSDADTTADCTISTPGTVIENRLETQFGTDIRQLELAQSIDQVLGALASQLVSQVLGATGLLGSSQPSSGGDRSAITNAVNRLQTASPTSQLVNGFEERVRTELSETTAKKGSWETFKPIAEQAVAACVSDSSNQTMAGEARAALTKATTNIAKATTNIASLTDILSRLDGLTPTSQNYAAISVQLTNQYNQILSSGNIETLGNSLTTRMNAIISSGCN